MIVFEASQTLTREAFLQFCSIAELEAIDVVGCRKAKGSESDQLAWALFTHSRQGFVHYAIGQIHSALAQLLQDPSRRRDSATLLGNQC